MENTFIYEEKTAANTLGVSRKTLKRARERISKNGNWTIRNRKIYYSGQGIQKLISELGQDDVVGQKLMRELGQENVVGQKLISELGQENVVGQKPMGGPELRRLEVEGTCRNPQIVIARLKKDEGLEEELLRVRVRNNKNFVKGMEIQCRHLQADLWEFVGRCPRARGRW